MRSGVVCPSMAPAKRRAHQYAGRYESKMRGWRDVYSGVMCIYRRRRRKTRKRKNFRVFNLWVLD
ncbi:hypothetical protein HanRHA438_Chr16g0786411 [Helianthus annuus]|uniref:Uncharacterized protein n=1 Tax=Helianthus annuus TaxID=4232 RepID=A0A9K3DVI9_HELAN|nr:hypothetical protein HanXRQr2_Chr16g0775741 [Helianthus annuus]KAJ0440088.1 hypothetical protein HanHA300_Chr16g0632551 [Helianthus annuus]KAJ0445376.1 hypothetical protein HanIR_Chr16g0842221 [Helianthus annuus]KAJ0462466.1 hypothetical protein HanHA89_Chr16g0683691 [Helianthus annuus]KAJ0646729.1 hypothetical protein HanOQP8_Chr16g0638401 [Helianthus annuus]